MARVAFIIVFLGLFLPFLDLQAQQGTLSSYKTIRCKQGDAVRVKHSKDKFSQVCYKSASNESLHGYTVNSDSNRFKMWVFNESTFVSYPFRVDRAKPRIRYGHQGLGPFKVSLVDPQSGLDLRPSLAFENSVSGAMPLDTTGNMVLKVDASAPWYIIIE